MWFIAPSSIATILWSIAVLRTNEFPKVDSNYLPDEFQLITKAVYLYCSKGLGYQKIVEYFFESQLQVTATTRNWTKNELINIAD